MNHQAHVSHVLIATFFSVPDDFPLNQTLVDPPSLEDDIDAYLISQSRKADTPQVEAMLKLLGLYQTLSPVSQHVLTSFTESAAPRAALLSTYILLWKHIDATRLAPLYFSRLAAVPASQYPEMDNIDSIFIDNAQRAEIDDFENLASSENLQVQYAALYALRN